MSDKRKRADTVPAPLVVSPSQNFYGPDGAWNAFTIEVGTPAQAFDVLVSTKGSETWVPLPEGCTSSDASNCPSLRGVLATSGVASSGFQTNQSSTWSLNGLYALDLENDLGYDGNGEYGTDVLGLNGGNDSTSTGGLALSNQIVAGIAAKDYQLGILGLGIQPTSFSNNAPQKKSLVENLKDANLIPSLSYGFTAGAKYEEKGVMAGLVLGGYDQSRFTPSNLSFTFASLASDSLTVGVQSIIAQDTLKGDTSFTSDGSAHMSVIDSTVPHIWLPRSICDQMETAFGLQYDNLTDLYLVNDTMHEKLVADGPTITFKLGNTDFDNGNSTNIVLPYAAFDLQVGWPIYSENQKYFPVRRAANSTQYTLGRTLLQHAYLVVDYERRNFTLGQAIHADPMPDANIITITTKDSTTSTSSKSTLSTGVIAGIGLGAIVLIVLSALIAFLAVRRRRRTQSREHTALDTTSAKTQHDLASSDGDDSENLGTTVGATTPGATMTTTTTTMLSPLSPATELSAEDEHRKHELPGQMGGGDKGWPGRAVSELHSPVHVHEMSGNSPFETVSEMEGTPVLFEKGQRVRK